MMNATEEELQSLDRRPALGTREEEAEEGDLQTGAAAAEVTNAQTNRAAAVPPVGEGDLEAGRPAAEVTNVQPQKSFPEKVLSIMPTLKTSFLYFTLPALYALLQIKWQLAPHGFLRPTPHNWYIVCVTSLLTELVASIAQGIIHGEEGR